MVMRTLHVGGLGAIYDPATWNAALLAGPKELQDFLGWLCFGDTDAGYGTVGFDASASSLNVTVKRGGGLVYDASPSAHASDAQAGLSKWSWIYNGGDVVKAIGAHHATLPRWDLISLTWTTNPDTTVNVGYRESVPADTKTQRGTQITLTVTAGTADASPVKPSTPAGAIALWYVYVPATSGALTLIDARQHLPGTKNRPGAQPMTSVTDVSTDANLFEVLARKILSTDTAWLSSLRWDVAKDMPYILRGKGTAGEIATALYPMLTAGDRTFWETRNFVDGSPLNSDDTALEAYGSDALGYMNVNRGTASAAISRVWLGIPVQARGLEVIGAKFRYRTTQAFDATVGSAGRAMKLVHVAADGTVTELLSHNLTIASTQGAVTTVAYTESGGDDGDLAATPVIAEGDSLYWFFMLELNADGTGSAGDLRLYSASVQFREGRSA